jgi:SPFH domain / Band 7 family
MPGIAHGRSNDAASEKGDMKRLLTFLMILIAVWSLETWWVNSLQADLSTRFALRQLDGLNADADRLRTFDAAKDAVHMLAVGITVLAAILCFGRQIKAVCEKIRSRIGNAAPLLIGALCVTGLTGCIRPYDKPQFVEVDTSETGFLIPLEGDATQQEKFQSEEYLKQRKIATKRVQITHRWLQEGRLPSNGRWIPVVRLVKVNRSPVTRAWTTPQNTSSGVQMTGRTDQAIWIESGDSVGFSMGFSCTAFISEADAARFLYWYPSGSLATVMDQEVRGRIQQVAAEVATKYPLDVLRAKKQEIADTVKNDVTNFFATRGVTVTTIGMFGGMTYENPEIQKSIDGTFIAQQLKVVAEAKFEAQKKENERIELEANAVAEKARREAMGLADARKTTAAAEADAIRSVNRAINEAQQNPLLYQLKALDVERARIEKWDGKYPTYFMGAGTGGPNLLLQVPTPGAPVADR